MNDLVTDPTGGTRKEAGIKDVLGKVWRGSEAHPFATTAGRAAMLGLGGYGAGRLGSYIFGKDKYNGHRVGLAGAAALMPLAGLGNYGRMGTSIKRKLLGRDRPNPNAGLQEDGSGFTNRVSNSANMLRLGETEGRSSMPGVLSKHKYMREAMNDTDASARNRANKMLGNEHSYGPRTPGEFGMSPETYMKRTYGMDIGSPRDELMDEVNAGIKFPKSGELRIALIKTAFKLKVGEKRASMGLTGYDGPAYTTFLPPSMTHDAGRTFSKNYTMAEIDRDENMGPAAKARAMDIVGRAGGSGKTGLISGTQIAEGVVGLGIGFGAANLFGKVLSATFSGISPIVQRRLSQVGAVAGMLKNTGIL